ncbi:hypothetical protein KEJ48_03195, partial [Candidatus Bathyarchaeota archaeon]|nr:hypothetical protein [Candidatus Bathyarchaeota archaeon]
GLEEGEEVEVLLTQPFEEVE